MIEAIREYGLGEDVFKANLVSLSENEKKWIEKLPPQERSSYNSASATETEKSQDAERLDDVKQPVYKENEEADEIEKEMFALKTLDPTCMCLVNEEEWLKEKFGEQPKASNQVPEE